MKDLTFLQKGAVYSEPETGMILRVLDGSKGPGVIPLAIARKYSEDAEARLSERISVIETSALTETKGRTDADTALSTRIDAVKASIVPLTGTLTLAAGISLLVGKTMQVINVTGLKKSDNLVVTPNAALPANISMGEAYCLADGKLTVVLLNTALLNLNIATAQTIPLGIIALRP